MCKKKIEKIKRKKNKQRGGFLGDLFKFAYFNAPMKVANAVSKKVGN